MYILLGIITIIIGVMMIAKPRMIYEFTERWKNSSHSEPSESYVRYTKFNGIWIVIVGVVLTLGPIFFP